MSGLFPSRKRTEEERRKDHKCVCSHYRDQHLEGGRCAQCDQCQRFEYSIVNEYR